MVKLACLAFAVSAGAYTCSPQEKMGSATGAAATDTVRTASVDFAKDIQPILQGHCTPCHFPGGKMYATMPFDKPKTIRDHSAGILRRIKGEEEVNKLKAFLAAVSD